MEEQLEVLPIHRHPQFMQDCCRLINSEWKRSETARMRTLEASCDTLPTCLILVRKRKEVVGHSKLSLIPSLPGSCFVESVVIHNKHRGKGWGKFLMKGTEEYASGHGFKLLYLSTQGQERFYSKLGYEECEPVCIYGGFLPVPSLLSDKTENSELRKYQVVQLPLSQRVVSSLSKSLPVVEVPSLPPTPPPLPQPQPQVLLTSVSTSLTKNTLVFSKKTFMKKIL